MERQSPDSTTQASRSYRAETGHDTERNQLRSRTMTTDRLQAGKNGESECIILYTLTRVEADITSSLGMKTTTELCHQKCRRIQASRHKQAGIYIRGMGAGVDSIQYGMVMRSTQCKCGQFHSSRHKGKSHIFYIYSILYNCC